MLILLDPPQIVPPGLENSLGESHTQIEKELSETFTSTAATHIIIPSHLDQSISSLTPSGGVQSTSTLGDNSFNPQQIFDYVNEDFEISDKQPRKRVAFSHLKSFQRCALSYYMKYVLRVTVKLGARSAHGIVMHSLAEKLVKDEAKGKQTSEEEALQTYIKNLEKTDRNDEINPEQRKALIEKAKKEIKSFREKENARKEKKVKTLHTEKRFDIKVGDTTIIGTVDRLEQEEDGTIVVRELKTGEKHLNSKVKDNKQLMIYGMAVQKQNPNAKIKLALEVMGADGKPQPISYEPSKEELDKVANEMDQFSLLLTKGLFAPTKKPYICSGCDFRLVCPASKHWFVTQNSKQ